MRHPVHHEPTAAERHMAARPDGPVDAAKVASWPPRVRAEIRSLLLHGVTDQSSQRLREAVREITDLIDEAVA